MIGKGSIWTPAVWLQNPHCLYPHGDWKQMPWKIKEGPHSIQKCLWPSRTHSFISHSFILHPFMCQVSEMEHRVKWNIMPTTFCPQIIMMSLKYIKLIFNMAPQVIKCCVKDFVFKICDISGTAGITVRASLGMTQWWGPLQSLISDGLSATRGFLVKKSSSSFHPGNLKPCSEADHPLLEFQVRTYSCQSLFTCPMSLSFFDVSSSSKYKEGLCLFKYSRIPCKPSLLPY